jgi:NAD(P)-dependent dehydrogenase (short-subunit alcohol dehydrogenase family)
MSNPVRDAIALVTGGTTGIGLAAARRLFEDGHTVVITGQNPRTLAAARQELPDAVHVVEADARSMSDLDRLQGALERLGGRVRVAFLNAGTAWFRPIDAVTEADFDEQFDVNVKGQYFTLQRVLPMMSPGGSVIFNGAVGADKGFPNWSILSGAKGALASMTRALAVELGPRGIRVNMVRPGPIDTPVFSKLGLSEAELGALTQWVTSRAPMARMGRAEEVAQAVSFLASDASSYVTGSILSVDGGLSIS